jgi:hypothetical protein
VVLSAEDHTLMRRHFDQLRRDPHVQDVSFHEVIDHPDAFDFEVVFVEGATRPQQRELHGLHLRYAHDRSLTSPKLREFVRRTQEADRDRQLREALHHPGPIPDLHEPLWATVEMLVQERRSGRLARVVEVVTGPFVRVRFVWVEGDRTPELMDGYIFTRTFEPAGRDLTPPTWQERLLDTDDQL